MAQLDENLTAQLAALMPRMTEDVELVAWLDESSSSSELRDLLDEISALSSKITVVEGEAAHAPGKRRPSFAIRRVSDQARVFFAGIPLGHEFTSLVLALLQAGGNPVKEETDLIDQVRDLQGEFEFVTYMSLSCQNCPAVVQALNAMAVLNPGVRHIAVEGSLFQDEINEREIKAVPTVYLNGELFGQGRMELADIVAKVDSSAAEKSAARLNAEAPFDVLVIGQGPAGVSAAIYAARKGLRTGLVGERFGGQVLDTMAIENFISVPHTQGPKFAADLAQHVADYDIKVIKNQAATGLIPAQQPGGLITVQFGAAELRSRTVIIATGARWRTMAVPGEDEYRNKGVTFCPHCDGPLFKGKPIAVIGGGNSGVEAAIDLAGVASRVTVVEFMDQLKADDVLVDKLHSLPNTDVILGAASTEVKGDGSKVTDLAYDIRATGEAKQLSVEGIFVQIGLLPNTEWVKDSLETNRMREIVIDHKGVTSLPGVFAAGDCASVPFKQIVIAQGSGATAALSAFDYLIRTPETS